jgi:uncharacterized membrane protein
LAINLATIVAVFLLSATAEILIAIPFGVFVLGMDPALALLAGYPGNLIPMAIILTLFGYLDKRFPRFSSYLDRRSRRFHKHLQGKYGSVFLFLIIPITGVYGASIATGLLRLDRKRSFLVQSFALAFFGAVEVSLLYLGIRLVVGP